MTDPLARARAVIGTPFRLQGREPHRALDCVGLVLHAFALDVLHYPSDYSATRFDVRAFKSAASAHFATVEACDRRAGDVLITSIARSRLHLALFTGSGVIHADARLRKVVEWSGTLPHPILGVLRRHPCSRGNDYGHIGSQ